MRIGIGLPNTVPGTSGKELADWARAAEEAGFSTLGTIDRIDYGNYEPLIALSAAAAVTDRINLATTVMLGPLRVNATLLAKQVLSLDALAGGGRTILGIGLGDRDDDYELSGISKATRGTWMDNALAEIRNVWDGERGTRIGPRINGDRPQLIVAGGADASFARAARHGDGWIMGGGAPDQFAAELSRLESAWEKAGRDDRPKTMSLAYFTLGENARENAKSYLGDYYAWLGDDVADMIAGSAAADAETVRQYVAAFEATGCDELIFCPVTSDVAEVRLLAEAAGIA
jgi:alkanesulfonate monooxygenase SsuD/methylene tetrahydromethanopterin reductase-like flavin-dependent oxidoreductase (luciferase family)